MDTPRNRRIEKIKRNNPKLLKQLKKYYTTTNDNSYKSMDEKRFMKIIDIIMRHDKYSRSGKYDPKYENDNLSKIYYDYYHEISHDKFDFYEDLIYLCRRKYIVVTAGTFEIGTLMDCHRQNYVELYEILINADQILRKDKMNYNAAIYITNCKIQGINTLYQKYLAKITREHQEELDNNMQKVMKKYEALNEEIKSHSKEIITIVAIVVAIVPIIAINASQIQQFDSETLLIINGCFLIIISTIFFAIRIAFFRFKLSLFWLLLPLLIGLSLIIIA